MELRHLRYFVAVAEEGSLTNAAERRLHTAQPSLSRQIRDLELEVGVKLLERGARGIELTPSGRTFLDHARLALLQVEAAGEAARRAARPEKAAFVIGFLAGQEVDLRNRTRPGSVDRPPWMDIRLDDKAAMVGLQIRLRPIMLRSLHLAGYHCLGDLRWVSIDQLIQVFYIGRKTAKQIRAAIERREDKNVEQG